MGWARVERIRTEGRRLIAVSDVHGGHDVLRRLLGDIGYGEGDTLVVPGDFLERNPGSLATLRLMMELAKGDHVHILLGNNDDYLPCILRRNAGEAWTRAYLGRRRASALWEMAGEAGIDLDSSADFTGALAALADAYREELDWIESLPHIVDAEGITFAHAGLAPGPLDRQEAAVCLKSDAFADGDAAFDKLVVVGHWPTDNYRQGLMDYSPYFLPERNILSIDGGYGLKQCGQINACIWEGGDPHDFAVVSRDGLPQRVARDRQAASEHPFAIRFGANRVELLRREGETAVCFHPDSGRTLRLQSDNLYRKGEHWYCITYTDYRLPVEPGDLLSVVDVFEGRHLVKKNGEAGWYAGRLDPP